MSLNDILSQVKQSDARIATHAKDAIKQIAVKTGAIESRTPPTHLPDQRGLIHELFDTDKQVWLFFFDAGRYDFFDRLVWDYFTGELQRCYNGGIGYTGDWADRNLRYDFGNRGLYSWLPLREHQGEYDGRNYFDEAPDIVGDKEQEERLAALGYTTSNVERTYEISPQFVNEAVTNSTMNGGIIRYLKPHPPFDGLESLTSESTKTAETQEALANGELSYAELTAAYVDTYKTAFEHAQELIPELDGKIVITSDHGTCLHCGQLFHGRNHAKHDHLTVMPWFRMDGIV